MYVDKGCRVRPTGLKSQLCHFYESLEEFLITWNLIFFLSLHFNSSTYLRGLWGFSGNACDVLSTVASTKYLLLNVRVYYCYCSHSSQEVLFAALWLSVLLRFPWRGTIRNISPMCLLHLNPHYHYTKWLVLMSLSHTAINIPNNII